MSKVEVNEIDKQSGSTLTLGGSGTAVTLACGATQSGFGRTGTVDWQTGSIKTTTFTAVDGQGFFADTSSGAITMNLPAGTAGSIVSVVDYTNTFQNNNLTVSPNGSQKIGGVAADFVADTEGQSLTWIYVDDTEGWKNIQDSTSNAIGSAFISATGGTITTCGNFKIHTFTGPGTFCVSAGGNAAGSNSVEYIVVAGGASGGGGYYGGGGGAGGFRFASPTLAPLTYPAKPLAAPANVPVSVQGYPIAVGGGGATQASSCVRGNSGVASSFSTITSAGGGGGGVWGNSVPNRPLRSGVAGGSGGGAGSNNSPPSSGSAGTGGAGNTPPVSPAQGKDGGDGVMGASGPDSTAASAGGGGATACGGQGPAGPGGPGVGGTGGAGAGVPNAFGTSGVNCGSHYYFAGGGGGAGSCATGNTGGLGGGGFGGRYVGPAPPSNDGQAGTANTGGGGGGAVNNCRNSGAGGSGIVIIRYKFQ